MAIREASPQGHCAMLPAGSDRRAPGACRETGPAEAPKPRLLTHGLSRGLAGVRSPADPMFI